MKKGILLALILMAAVLQTSVQARDNNFMRMDEQSAHIKSQHRVPTLFADPQLERTEPRRQVSPVAQPLEFEHLQPFGANLFTGRFKDTYYDEINPEYMIMPGDRIGVRIWGALEFDQVLVVDSLGNIFIPTVGPVQVAGQPYAQLERSVEDRIRSVYAQDFETYVTLLNTQPTAVFVAGAVHEPGRYAGGFSESVLYYLDQAHGIDAQRGSYRDIWIIREGQSIASVDLYDFLLCGRLPVPRLKDGDVIMVSRKGISVGVSGHAANQAWFEFQEDRVSGEKILAMADARPEVSHVYVEGTREGAPYHNLLPVEDFLDFKLKDQDRVSLVPDVQAEVIPVHVQGPLEGESRFLVRRGTRLHELMHYIKVREDLASLKDIHLHRQSVAQRQKESLEHSLQRLEQTALTATSASVEESEIRIREAELIQQFVERTKEDVVPQGVVVVSRDEALENILLEKNDTIIIPNEDDVVLVTGEVRMPQAIVHDPDKAFEDYIDHAGGFAHRADTDNILVAKANGEILPLERTRIERGDHIMVLPFYETKSLQLAKDISQTLYHLAIATRTVIAPW